MMKFVVLLLLWPLCLLANPQKIAQLYEQEFSIGGTLKELPTLGSDYRELLVDYALDDTQTMAIRYAASSLLFALEAQAPTSPNARSFHALRVVFDMNHLDSVQNYRTESLLKRHYNIASFIFDGLRSRQHVISLSALGLVAKMSKWSAVWEETLWSNWNEDRPIKGEILFLRKLMHVYGAKTDLELINWLMQQKTLSPRQLDLLDSWIEAFNPQEVAQATLSYNKDKIAANQGQECLFISADLAELYRQVDLWRGRKGESALPKNFEVRLGHLMSELSTELLNYLDNLGHVSPMEFTRLLPFLEFTSKVHNDSNKQLLALDLIWTMGTGRDFDSLLKVAQDKNRTPVARKHALDYIFLDFKKAWASDEWSQIRFFSVPSVLEAEKAEWSSWMKANYRALAHNMERLILARAKGRIERGDVDQGPTKQFFMGILSEMENNPQAKALLARIKGEVGPTNPGGWNCFSNFETTSPVPSADSKKLN